MMKRSGLAWLAVLMVLVSALSACNNDKKAPGDTATKSGTAGKKISVGFYISGSLGDKSFYDSAKRGLDQAQKELGMDVKVVEGGLNAADWPAGIEQMIQSQKYDIVFTGSSQMKEAVQELSVKYPDQKFIFFDDAVENQPNVYSMTYSQSEGSFLAGAFAALVTTSKETSLKGVNPEKNIGFIGGMDIPIIKDFQAGYEQGAKYVDKDVNVIASYIGNFTDVAKGKELALAQYNSQKVDVIYSAAGGGALGALESAKELGKYAVGVDGNQDRLYPGAVLTSMMKRIDVTTFNALKRFKEKKLPFGQKEVFGVKDGGVTLTNKTGEDEVYKKHVPKSVQDKILEIEQKIASGEIKVQSTLK